MQRFNAGDAVWSVGLNSRCEPALCVGKFVEYRTPDQYGQDCVVLSGRVRVVERSADLYADRKSAAAAVVAAKAAR